MIEVPSLRPRLRLQAAATIVAIAGAAGVHAGTVCVNPGGTGGCQASIQAAVNAAAAGDTVTIAAGTYQESDIVVGKSLTIQGTARDSVVVAPAVADSHSGSLFSPGAHSCFILRAGSVTIRTLTINGDAGVGGAGSRNYRGGVVTDYKAAGNPYNAITVSGVAVRNTYQLGIYLDGGIGSTSSGHAVTGNLVQTLGGALRTTGILLMQANGTVTGNTVSDITPELGGGISTNYADGPAFGPTVTVRGNTVAGVRIAMNLSGLADGSVIGGPLAADRNTVDLSAPTEDVGIFLVYAVGQVVVENNLVTGATGTDAAVWLYRNVDPAKPVVLRNNTLQASASTASAAGRGTGVFASDDPVPFQENLAAACYVTLTGNVVAGFDRGVDVFRNGTNPAGGAPVEATVGGAGVGNSISGGSVAIRVFDANRGGAASKALATIAGNTATITGATVGIRVDGGRATINGNVVTGNGTGVAIANGGFAGGSQNNFATNPTAAVSNATGVDLAFTCNFWGSLTGPAVASNPGGVGQAVSANVVYDPWLLAFPGGNCNGDGGGTRGPAAALVFVTQPGNGVAGLPLNRQPAVKIVDEVGRLVVNSTATATLALATNPCGGSLLNALAQPFALGVAPFSTVAVSVPCNGYTLLASSPNVTSAISQPFDVGAPEAIPASSTLGLALLAAALLATGVLLVGRPRG